MLAISLGAELTARQPTGGWSSGVTIERVDPADDVAVRAFARVSMSGFLPEGAEIPEQHLQMMIHSTKVPTFDAFLARVDRVAAGAGSCETSEGGTALFGTSVKPGSAAESSSAAGWG